MVEGRMMDFPLAITHLLERARAVFGNVEVTSRAPDKSLSRRSYRETYDRCQQLARVLRRLGVARGERVATFCWNHQQHLECYLGIPAMGAVVHTLNLRLHPTELAYIANHAGDVVVVVDRSLLPLFAKFRGEIRSLRHVVVVPDCAGETPEGMLDYEAELAKETPPPHGLGFAPPEGTAFVDVDENEAAMICYTSGTTGNPKGVVYSHRSSILHAMAACTRDSLGIGCDDVALPVVPMFHAAAWGLPYATVAAGGRLVFPGPHLDPESLLDLMVAEKVTMAAGVPTIWNGILAKLDAEPDRWDLSTVRTMVIGGAAAPASMIRGFSERHRLEVTHAWGMTETNPLGTLAKVKPSVAARGKEAVMAVRASQGIPVPYVETRHVNDEGIVLAWDGESMGELEVRGPWVAKSYLGDEGKDRFTPCGWFKTGDVVTIDREGYVRITDRAKDVIKSGGEWISSVALENALMAHPAVLEAAVFAGRHAKWDERPIAAVVFKEGKTASDEELAAHLAPSFPKYWLPDAFVRLDQIPRNSTGKFMKSRLRDQFGEMFLTKP